VGRRDDTAAGWAWRIGSSHAHGGYQNPLAAYALSSYAPLRPRSATAAADWATSLGRQLEFYRWLQSAEGAIAGGATNSWQGRYATPPAGTPTFYGMYYDEKPVYHDPPSNQWFGFQAWSMERVAEYYQQTGNAAAKAVLDKWVSWALSGTTVNPDGTYRIPSTLRWSGAPDVWNPASPGANTGLHVAIVDYTDDVGVAGAFARTLTYYADRSGDTRAATTAKALLDGMWAHDQDALGVAVPETRTDYNRFDDASTSRAGGPARCRTATRSARRRRSSRSAPSTTVTRPGRRSRRTSPAGPRRRSPTTGSGRRRTSRWPWAPTRSCSSRPAARKEPHEPAGRALASRGPPGLRRARTGPASRSRRARMTARRAGMRVFFKPRRRGRS
jgi:hypothetical protein